MTMKYLKLAAILCFIFIGSRLAFHDDFLPLSTAIKQPIIFLVIFGPTVFFGAIGLIESLIKKTLDKAIAFSIGLFLTGIFNTFVAMKTAGDPGYMVPIGHLMSPVVSLAAYLFAFLGNWGANFIKSKSKGESS